VGAFVIALCEEQFTGQNFSTLAEGTIRNSISFLAQAFRENDRSNPTKDKDDELRRLLSKPFRSFRNTNSNPAQHESIQAILLIGIMLSPYIY